MNRIDQKFNELKIRNEKAMITFITAGDPEIDITKKLILGMEKSGADIIEIGIPYSDPVAEGPVIQEANARALKNDIKIKDVFQMVNEIRVDTQIPLIYLLYFNSILQFGIDSFLKACIDNGVDGLIIPDLPYEERDEIIDIANNYGVYIINLVTPSSGDRIKKIVKDAKGFIYCVSSFGVTGVRAEFNKDLKSFMDIVKQNSDIPTAIGFGISTPEQVTKLKDYSDGLIVGSAIVKLIGDNENIVEKVSNFVYSMKEATRNN